MSVKENQVIETLRAIIHPSKGVDIVSMGLVNNLITDTSGVTFDLVFGSAHEPLKSAIKSACEKILTEKFGKSFDTRINIITSSQQVNPSDEFNSLGNVQNIIAIASGKGGVGKSTVAANLALAFSNSGAKVGLIDADIFGPSIPKMLGVEHEKPTGVRINEKDLLVPIKKFGIKILSIGFFVDPEDATIWRGPMASNALKQMIHDTDWGELDYLFVDLPPGTSDIHLTLVQTVPVTGAVIVSTPQDVALADVIKGINMFKNQTINVPVLGLIENMSWFTPEELPDNKYYIFGKEGCLKLAQKTGIPLLGQIPLIQGIRESSDEGIPFIVNNKRDSEPYKLIADKLSLEVLKRNTLIRPTRKVNVEPHKYQNVKKESHG